ncbi:type I restriction-modification enzyme R subunit C-terminal domain-containing protein [Synechococcus elongatus IITB7]|uniref:type I restriction-modification enzyme R subunit C-terminal domain-containing protein n=1 Tax=Synechococcus elongatus TaxID=32046 RepID=UPI0030D509A4
MAKEQSSPSETLSTKLFRSRLALIQALDRSLPPEAIGLQDDQTDLPRDEADYRAQLAGQLRQTIQAMNPNNFLVKPFREAVQQWSDGDRWRKLDDTAGTLLADQLATLPSQLPSDDQAAREFDLLLYKLQIALLKQASDYPKLRSRVQAVAQLLEGRCAIPMVGAELSLIQDLQTQDWWEDVTLPLLEKVRRTLRGLVGLIEKTARQPLYTNFEDQLGEAQELDPFALITSDDFTRFRLQAKKFLLEHDSHLAIQRLRRNQPLTPTDLEELETFLLSNKIGSQAAIDRAKQESQGFRRFVRSLVGLDRNAAKEAFSEFLSDRLYSAAQIQFVNEIINYLTTHGVMDKALLYEPPFTNYCATGPEELFEDDSIDQLCDIIDLVSARAETAV